jgi:hypothetical protein
VWRSYIIPRPLWKSKPTLLFFLPTDELAPPQITLSHLKRALVNVYVALFGPMTGMCINMLTCNQPGAIPSF